jgi:hypothetical protein
VVKGGNGRRNGKRGRDDSSEEYVHEWGYAWEQVLTCTQQQTRHQTAAQGLGICTHHRQDSFA